MPKYPWLGLALLLAGSCLITTNENLWKEAGVAQDGGSEARPAATDARSASAERLAADAQLTDYGILPDWAPSLEGKLPLGAACHSDSACQSNHCADEVCCDAACEGPCVACNLRDHGGLCTALPAGTDPDEGCPAEPESTCGFDGSCDGQGACRRYAEGTSCSASCTGPSIATEFRCDGKGSCGVGSVAECLPFACDAERGSCFTSCTADAHCHLYRCNLEAGTCYSSCRSNAECQSGVRCSASGECT